MFEQVDNLLGYFIGKDWRDVFRRAVKTILQSFLALTILVLLGQGTFTLAVTGAIVAGGLSVIQNAMSRDPATHTLV